MKLFKILFTQPKTERVVNIVKALEDKTLEGFETNSVFRVINRQHELELIKINKGYCIEVVAAISTPFTCPLNKFRHEHGCYSAE
ncbi:hypothetical protein [Nostoc sp.]